MTKPASDIGYWRKVLAPYQNPELVRSVTEIAITLAPLAMFWAAAYWAAQMGLWWATLLLCVPAGFFLVRLFIIQHDCGHRSYFRSRQANDWVGRFLGVLTMTPHGCWRRSHAQHHATSGNLDRRGLGAVDTLTVEEYRALSAWGRFGYRLYRHPIVMFGIGPAYLFLVQNRVPFGLWKESWRVWADTMTNNLGVALFIGAIVWLGGWSALAIFVASVVIAASIGVWLFYVQHQYEDTYWARQEDWNLGEAALLGSSHLVLPKPLCWLTGHIGIHHVHHLSARIPFYKLPKVIKDHPALAQMSRMKLSETVKCTGLALWDEANRNLVSFRQAKAIPAAA